MKRTPHFCSLPQLLSLALITWCIAGVMGHSCGTVFAQLIGKAPATSSAAEEESDKVSAVVSKLAERLTTQELNLKKISCREHVVVERYSANGAASSRLEQDFLVTGEMKQQGAFSSDSVFVETHSPMASADADRPRDAIEPSQLVRDSLSTAAEFLGLNHQEIYAQRFVRKETLDQREAYVVAFQTVKQMESRKIQMGDALVPMRLSGRAWISTGNATLLRLEVRQTKLPRDVREFSYDVRYDSTPSGFILPTTVQFKRTLRRESILTTQSLSNCRVN